MKDFSYYKDCFSTLHTAKSKGFFAPHKPLLLLSVIDLVERGIIRSNRIELSETWHSCRSADRLWQKVDQLRHQHTPCQLPLRDD
jgi:putative restriction endonuclease